MLRHLRVTNFAILSHVALDFDAGFNALTGETGAGKSLIVDAVNLLRGGRASADIPREGADEAVVEAIFDIPDDLAPRIAAALVEAGLPDDGAELLVRRVIQRGGRSRTYVNGALTTASCLADIGSLLVDLSSQHQHQGLVDPRHHRAILDAFADATPALTAMAAAWEQVSEARSALAELSGDEAALQDRIDYLRFQADELEQARLVPGEEAALDQERERLHAVDQLVGGARRAEELAYGGDQAAVDLLGAAARELERITALDDRLAEPARQLEEARALAEDAASALRDYADGFDADPQRLEEVEDRLALIARLKRKHGGSYDDVLARRTEIAVELERLSNRDAELARLGAQLARADAAARDAAARLSAIRRGAADRLVGAAGPLLAELGMKAAELTVTIDAQELGAHGADRIELRLAANPGEPAKPLAKVASGGELSRIMLALKLALRRADQVATYVFDEVDTGVGGAMAEVLGRQIRALADQRQVLCVTHLPQIAAFADRHFVVAKRVAEGRTETDVEALGARERRDEISRMLGGVKITAKTRAHADEMLREAAARRP
jgi:DNA repair protein RecN (Recombination protein N)